MPEQQWGHERMAISPQREACQRLGPDDMRAASSVVENAHSVAVRGWGGGAGPSLTIQACIISHVGVPLAGEIG